MVPKFFDHGREHRLHFGFFRNVCLVRVGFDAAAGDVFDDRFSARDVGSIVHDHIGACFAERQRRSAADAGARARHQRFLAAERLRRIGWHGRILSSSPLCRLTS